MLYWSRVSGFSSLMFLSLVYSLLYAILEPSVWILLFNVFKFSILPSLCYIGAECLDSPLYFFMFLILVTPFFMLYWSRVSGFSSLMFLSLVYSLLYAILEPSVWILLFNVFKFSILPSLCYIGAECLDSPL